MANVRLIFDIRLQKKSELKMIKINFLTKAVTDIRSLQKNIQRITKMNKFKVSFQTKSDSTYVLRL